MTYTLRREENEHGRVSLFVEWCAGKPKHEIGMDRNGGMWLHSFDHNGKQLEAGYLYSDEAKKVAEAFALLCAEHEQREQAKREERDRWQRSCREREFYGCSVDLSPAETFEALQGIEIRIIDRWPEVRYKGQWLRFGRTDLMDDVATGHYVSSDAEARGFVDMKAALNYGARVSDRGFFVVDSMTDG